MEPKKIPVSTHHCCRTAPGIFALPVLLVLIWVFAPITPESVESSYGRTIYPFLTRCIVPVSDAIAWPLGPWLSAGLVVTLAIFSWRSWLRGRRTGTSRVRLLGKGALWTLGLALYGYVTFLLLWGAAYRRPPLEQNLGLEAKERSSAEIMELAERVRDVVESHFVPPKERDFDSALASTRLALLEIAREWRLGETRLPRHVKRLPDGWLLRGGTAGMCFPFTHEAYVDGALPGVSFLPVATHEIAHVAGLARESDADLAALFAGLHSKNRLAIYAAALGFLRDLERELDARDRDRLRRSLSEGVLRDIREAREAREKYHSPALASIQRKVYDHHLRAQGIEEGIANYSRALLLAAHAIDSGLLRLPLP